MELVVASKNPGKVREIKEVLDATGLVLLTTDELGDWEEPEETGGSLEENAIIKAVSLRDRFGRPALADDSGLEVDHLSGAPGVQSARYAGKEGDSDKNMARLLEELKNVTPEERTARFRCVMALAMPGDIRLSRGMVEGTILTERHGEGGFGYDPVFLPKGFSSTMAELSVEAKNEISHRGKALREMSKVLQTLVKDEREQQEIDNA